jgi:hypothetical protein
MARAVNGFGKAHQWRARWGDLPDAPPPRGVRQVRRWPWCADAFITTAAAPPPGARPPPRRESQNRTQQEGGAAVETV